MGSSMAIRPGCTGGFRAGRSHNGGAASGTDCRVQDAPDPRAHLASVYWKLNGISSHVCCRPTDCRVAIGHSPVRERVALLL